MATSNTQSVNSPTSAQSPNVLKGPVRDSRRKSELLEIARAFGWTGNESATKKQLVVIINKYINDPLNADRLQTPQFQGLIQYRASSVTARTTKASGKNSSDKVEEDRKAEETKLELAVHPPPQFQPLNVHSATANARINSSNSMHDDDASSELSSLEDDPIRHSGSTSVDAQSVVSPSTPQKSRGASAVVSPKTPRKFVLPGGFESVTSNSDPVCVHLTGDTNREFWMTGIQLYRKHTDSKQTLYLKLTDVIAQIAVMDTPMKAGRIARPGLSSGGMIPLGRVDAVANNVTLKLDQVNFYPLQVGEGGLICNLHWERSQKSSNTKINTHTTDITNNGDGAMTFEDMPHSLHPVSGDLPAFSALDNSSSHTRVDVGANDQTGNSAMTFDDMRGSLYSLSGDLPALQFPYDNGIGAGISSDSGHHIYPFIGDSVHHSPVMGAIDAVAAGLSEIDTSKYGGEHMNHAQSAGRTTNTVSAVVPAPATASAMPISTSSQTVPIVTATAAHVASTATSMAADIMPTATSAAATKSAANKVDGITIVKMPDNFIPDLRRAMSSLVESRCDGSPWGSVKTAGESLDRWYEFNNLIDKLKPWKQKDGKGYLVPLEASSIVGGMKFTKEQATKAFGLGTTTATDENHLWTKAVAGIPVIRNWMADPDSTDGDPFRNLTIAKFKKQVEVMKVKQEKEDRKQRKREREERREKKLKKLKSKQKRRHIYLSSSSSSSSSSPASGDESVSSSNISPSPPHKRAKHSSATDHAETSKKGGKKDKKREKARVQYDSDALDE
ncbi:hypothetical protein EV360DRAFT_83774 [Lentinula raphanica]|nr:hypothetical protein EV360DRAFT_83774 [Lentinula raphanica]